MKEDSLKDDLDLKTVEYERIKLIRQDKRTNSFVTA